LGIAGEMTLRVRGGEHDSRVLKIRSPKCSIGSAAGCTLRLQAAGVNPLSCWILRGPAGTIIRRLHGPAALNGARFEEATLRAGDCLRVGTVELEIVQCNEAIDAATPLFPPLEAPAGELSQLKAELAVLQDRAARLEAECRQGFEASIMAAERADQLRDALNAAHEQMEAVATDLAAAQDTVSQQSEDLDQKHRELDQLHAKERSLAAQLDEANRLARTAAEEREAVAQERDALVQSRDALTQERDALTQERDARTQERDALAQERDALGGELGALRGTLQQQQEQFQEERNLLQRRLAQRDAEIEALRSSSNAQTGVMTVAIHELTESQQGLRQELESRCADLQSQLAAKQAELDNLQQQHGQLQSELGTKQAELETQTRRLDELTAQRTAREAELASQHEQVCHELTETRQQLEAARAEGAASADLAARQQLLASEHEQLAAKVASIEQQQRDIDAAKQSIEAQSAELAKTREQWEAERDELLLQKQELADAQEELAHQRVALEQQKEWLLAAQQQQANGQSLEAELQARSAELETQLAAAGARLNELERLRDELLSERAALAERTQEHDQRVQQLAERRQQFELQARQPDDQSTGEQESTHEAFIANSLESSDASPVNCTAVWSAEQFAAVDTPSNGDSGAKFDEPAPQSEISSSPASSQPSDSGDVDELLGRLVRAGLWRSDEPAPSEPENYTPPARLATAAAPSPDESEPADEPLPMPTAIVPAPIESGEEESIESYMERLMKRVRGDAPVAGRLQPVAAPVELPQPATPESATPEPVQEAAAQPAEEPVGDFSPRRTAPELATNMSAMRELANTAARTAIDRHVRQHTGKQAAGKLLGAFLTVAASSLLGYWAVRVQSLPAGAGSLIGGSVGAYWTWAAIKRLASLRRLNQLAGQAPAGQEPLASAGSAPRTGA
jgi:hypothetical protein